jgi:hypothetical protein
VRGKWVRARYIGERQVIEQQYAEWEITGAAEIRDVDPRAGYSNSCSAQGCYPMS